MDQTVKSQEAKFLIIVIVATTGLLVLCIGISWVLAPFFNNTIIPCECMPGVGITNNCSAYLAKCYAAQATATAAPWWEFWNH